MEHDPKAETSLADRRQSERQDADGAVRVRFETDALGGRLCDASPAGVMFTSTEPLRVSVEVDRAGRTETRVGRLVRVSRLDTQHAGFAIEFDPDPAA